MFECSIIQIVPLELEGAKLPLFWSGSLAPFNSKGTRYPPGWLASAQRQTTVKCHAHHTV